MVRAALEGAAFSLRHNLETAEHAGAIAENLRSIGGAANSMLWTQIKTDVTGKPIFVPSSDMATTLGAALLAGVATGIYRDFKDAVSKTVRITRKHEPNPENSQAYQRAYETFIGLYEKLEPFMRGER